MEKVRPWCGQPSDRGRLKNRTELPLPTAHPAIVQHRLSLLRTHRHTHSVHNCHSQTKPITKVQGCDEVWIQFKCCRNLTILGKSEIQQIYRLIYVGFGLTVQTGRCSLWQLLLLCFVYLSGNIVVKKVARTRLPSIEFRSWSQFLAVSLQVSWVSGRLSLLSARLAVTPTTLKRAATIFAAWWTEAWWVWTVCLRLLPDSVAAAIWTQALLCLSPAR